MADIDADIEALETRLMQAWMDGDARGAKALMAGDCLMMFGSSPPVLLDRRSFITAFTHDFACERFRFGGMTARRRGRFVWFTSHVELALKIGRREWSGGFLLTDLWVKSRFARRWKLSERSLGPLSDTDGLSAAIQSRQLWR